MNLCEQEKCTGCMACYNICPKKAIVMAGDALGKTVPSINGELCIECGLCSKACPELNPLSLHRAKYAYAVWSKDTGDIESSSSGGAAAVFSRAVINRGGLVFGATVDGTDVRHIGIDKIEDIDKLRGSKYVQSDIGESYRQAKEALEQNKEVLFIGTPCQIAGLRNYLKKDYDKLLAVDLICHGTPPSSYLKEHLRKIVHGAPCEKVLFRGKKDFFLTVLGNSDKVLYQKDRTADLYFWAFMEGLTYRDNCYECCYARPERVGDITIGDFWGINRKSLKTPYKGKISLVLPNTEKGGKFFENNRDGMVWEEKSFEEAANPSQGNLIHPSIPHPDREKFCNLYPKAGFTAAVRKTKIGKDVARELRKEQLRKLWIWKMLSKTKNFLVKGLH